MAHKSNPYKKAGKCNCTSGAVVGCHHLAVPLVPGMNLFGRQPADARHARSSAGSGRRSARAACRRSAERCASARSDGHVRRDAVLLQGDFTMVGFLSDASADPSSAEVIHLHVLPGPSG